MAVSILVLLVDTGIANLEGPLETKSWTFDADRLPASELSDSYEGELPI